MAIYTLISERTLQEGTIQSAIIDVPPGLRYFEARGIMAPEIILDVTLVLTWRIYATFDGTKWVQLIGSGWQGGIDDEGNPVGVPNQTWQTSGSLPLQVQGELTVSKRTRLGLQIEIR